MAITLLNGPCVIAESSTRLTPHAVYSCRLARRESGLAARAARRSKRRRQSLWVHAPDSPPSHADTPPLLGEGHACRLGILMGPPAQRGQHRRFGIDVEPRKHQHMHACMHACIMCTSTAGVLVWWWQQCALPPLQPPAAAPHTEQKADDIDASCWHSAAAAAVVCSSPQMPCKPPPLPHTHDAPPHTHTNTHSCYYPQVAQYEATLQLAAAGRKHEAVSALEELLQHPMLRDDPSQSGEEWALAASQSEAHNECVRPCMSAKEDGQGYGTGPPSRVCVRVCVRAGVCLCARASQASRLP